jgi:hypothetical protein
MGDDAATRRVADEAENMRRARTALPAHFALADALQDLAAEALSNLQGGPGPGPSQVSPAEFAQQLLFRKAFKSFWSILLLAERRLTDDVGIILRSLFNLRVIARWIRNDPGTRARRYLEWFWIAARPILEAHAERLQAHPDLLAPMAQTDEFFQQQGWEIGKGKEWHGSSIKRMAEEVGLAKHYKVVYRGLSSVEHSDVMAHIAMIRASGPGLSLSLWSDSVAGEYLGLAVSYFLCVFEEWNAEVQAVTPERIHALGERSVELLRPEDRPETPEGG